VRRVVVILYVITILVLMTTLLMTVGGCFLLNKQINELDTLHTQYMVRVHILQEMFSPYEDFLSDDNEPSENVQNEYEFMAINRSPVYLKESTHDFFKSQELENLLTQLDHEMWQEYNGHISSGKQPISKLKVTRKQPQSNKKINYKKPGQKITNAPPFRWPIDADGFWISSFFGPRRKKDGSIGFHHGIDMAAVKGTPVCTAAEGVVVEARYGVGYGNVVVVRHTQRFKTRYAHLNSMCVKVGQKVPAKKIIGYVGETGFIRKRTKDGSHLHFEICDNGRYINPLILLPVL
jgi:murein DD-endopeptidase MepM/ murein hydrolase activator NlpD